MTMPPIFDKGRQTENEFEGILKETGMNYERNKTIKDENGINFQVDFQIFDMIVEITWETTNQSIQKLCYRAEMLRKEGQIPTLIIPVASVWKRHAKMIANSFEYVFDIGDLKKAVSFIEAFWKVTDDKDDIYVKKLNMNYIKYLEGFSKNSTKKPDLCFEYLNKFYEKPIKPASTLKDTDDSGAKVQEKMYLLEIDKNMDILLKRIFKNADLSEKAKQLLLLIKKDGAIDSSSEAYTKLGISYSQYYGNILKKLKRQGLIRKEGNSYIIDSKYSMERIREASIWIDFAEIKRYQPKEIARIVLSLFGIEDVLKD